MFFHFCLGKVLTSAQTPQVVGVQRILAQASWHHVVHNQIMISQCNARHSRCIHVTVGHVAAYMLPCLTVIKGIGYLVTMLTVVYLVRLEPLLVRHVVIGIMRMQFSMHVTVSLIKRDDPMTSDLTALVYLGHACHLLSDIGAL